MPPQIRMTCKVRHFDDRHRSPAKQSRPPRGRTASPEAEGQSSGLGRRGRPRGWSVAPLGHELVELGLVLGEAQPLQKLTELALLLLETLERLGAVLVERAVAARRRVAEAAEPAAEVLAHALHFALPVLASMTPTSHIPAPQG